MIGLKSYEIDVTDFLRGMSSSDFINDGGFSNKTEAVNLTKTPGLLYSAAEKVDQTDDLQDDLIASCEDPRVYTSGTKYQRLFVDVDGNYYAFDGTTLDLIDTDATNPTKYSKGKTDMIAFGEDTVYTTNAVAITSWTVSTGAVTDAFYNFTGSYAPVVPHPALVYENNAYYANGNTLLRQTTVGGTPAVILTLPPEQVIVTLGIDPGTGKMLISIVDSINMSDTFNRISRIGYYDGFSNKLSKVIIVDEMVTAFYPVGATMFVGYGQKLGVWNGAGLQFMRALNVTLNSEKLPYKHNFANIDDTLYVVEGNKVLAYGEVIATAPRVFYYAHINKNASLVDCDLNMICSLGSGTLGLAWIDTNAAAKFATLDTTSVSTLANSAFNLWSNKKTFARPVTFNNLVVEYGAALPTSGAYADVSIYDDTQTQNTIKSSATNTVSGMYTAEYPYPSISTRSIQVRMQMNQGTGQTPIRRMTVFYTPTD